MWSTYLCLWIEEDVTQQSDDVEHEEDVEVSETDRCQSLRAELRKDEVDCPVGEGRDGVSESADLDWEDLGGIDPGYDSQRGVEEREYEVHRHHGTKHVGVIGIQVLAHGGINNERSTASSSREDQGLDTTDLVERQKTDRAVDDGKSTANADDHQ